MLEPIVYTDQQKYFQIKINAGQQIFKSGGVIRLSDLEYNVKSATTQEMYKVFYNYNENRFNCSCPNWSSVKKYNNIAGHCKHIFSVLSSLQLIQ